MKVKKSKSMLLQALCLLVLMTRAESYCTRATPSQLQEAAWQSEVLRHTRVPCLVSCFRDRLIAEALYIIAIEVLHFARPSCRNELLLNSFEPAFFRSFRQY